MTSEELEIIHADLMVAKNCLTPPDEKKAQLQNPFMINMGAYHAEQAIEKSLKAVIREGGKMDAELATTHNLSRLLVVAELVQPNIIQEHPFIAENSDVLSQANGLRYGTKSISLYDAKGLLFNANALYKQLEERHYLESGKNVQEQRSESVQAYSRKDRLNFSRPDLQKDEDDAPVEPSGMEME